MELVVIVSELAPVEYVYSSLGGASAREARHPRPDDDGSPRVRAALASPAEHDRAAGDSLSALPVQRDTSSEPMAGRAGLVSSWDAALDARGHAARPGPSGTPAPAERSLSNVVPAGGRPDRGHRRSHLSPPSATPHPPPERPGTGVCWARQPARPGGAAPRSPLSLPRRTIKRDCHAPPGCNESLPRGPPALPQTRGETSETTKKRANFSHG